MKEQRSEAARRFGGLRLSTKRLLLKKPEHADAQAVARQIGTVDVICNLATAPWPYHSSDAFNWLVHVDRSSGMGTFTFGIYARERAGELIGAIGLDTLQARADPCPALGYWLGVDHWGQGMMSEAVGAVLDFAFEQLTAPAIEATFLDENPASGRVLEKNGFHTVRATLLWSRFHGRYLPGQLMRCEPAG